MLDRLVRGDVPPKHHVAFRDAAGSLRWEECLTRKGFDGPYTILYHQHRPHEARVEEATHGWAAPVAADADRPLARRHYLGGQVPEGGPAVDARTPLLFNRDLILTVARPTEPDPVWVIDGEADELIFVKEGTGTLRTPLGDLRYGPLDYVCVPKGVAHRILPDAGVPQLFQTTLGHDLGLLSKWRNELGQLRMDAPYCHRDFRTPDFRGPVEDDVRQAVVRRDGRWHGLRLPRALCDVVGWDGTVYPWVFPILAFQPRAGLVHLPPDWHGTFSVRGALICSFVPRVVDFHPEAIPCPYPHSSVDCDEFLFYVQGNFTSRRGVGPGSISHHPYGLPHGPHPGAYEASVGAQRTDELAVMIDSFAPMRATAAALALEDPGYHDSFVA
ncbi:MAG: homogentisate 1,2-dioxygenase [Alphaproteobacteria bacterium]|nr:homogentisate 1,2-dioxygenase [Alphaproteobacteria bacterium]